MMHYRTRICFAVLIFYVGLSFCGQVSAQGGDELRTRLNNLTTKLKSEQRIAQRTEDKLVEARQDLDATSKELAEAKSLAANGASSKAVRDVRVISVRHDRHKEKVERYEVRVAEDKKNLARLRADIQNMKTEAKQLAEKERKTKLRQASLAAARERRVAAKPAPVIQAKAKVAESVPPRPVGWPYLSKARGTDIEYAKKRLRARDSDSRSGPRSAVSITASSSFGTAVLTEIASDLYSVVKPVKAGRQLFSNHKIKEWHIIPESDDNRNYRIVIDNSNKEKPQLFLFREDLLRR